MSLALIMLQTTRAQVTRTTMIVGFTDPSRDCSREIMKMKQGVAAVRQKLDETPFNPNMSPPRPESLPDDQKPLIIDGKQPKLQPSTQALLAAVEDTYISATITCKTMCAQPVDVGVSASLAKQSTV